ncbi:hypothetical protein KUTeg_012363 [Tegillarca granosa]|uniref:ABC transporter domain-containing protein n=1 Tax=Tegillarca granosa TaxID=220873 RepID=A0ABQ9F4H0_TEGGR|nr:hypothetical protein KUTeg_012363 [Tegillarca granosa]
MISVERVLDYARLPTEADLESDKDRKPPPEWPQNGAIRGDKVCLKYSENAPFVLKSLQFSINGKEKRMCVAYNTECMLVLYNTYTSTYIFQIGIVGRTGAGKSSLIAMLFRMVEPEGVIHIDDINIKKLGLHDLRNKISIIPQVQLKSVVEDIPGRLEAEVSEGGINFSVGQRQLICLARAILRQNKILMIDEATANVDPRTDALIQKTIREKFQDCTVLTIAHRLHTIMDSDRVLNQVMDEGRIAEFDQPYTLLTDKNSEFCKMALQTGQSEFEHLLEIAQKSYKSHDASGGMESVSHIDDGGHVDKDCDRSETVVTDKEVSSCHPSSDPVSEEPCSDSDKNSDELKTDLNKNMSVEPDSSSENKTEPVLHIENYDNNKLQNEKENSEISSRSSSSSSESNDRSETQDMFHTVEEDDPLLTNDIAGHKEPDPSLTPAQSNNDADHIESDPDVTNENTALLNISKNKSLLQKNQEPSEDDSNVLMESFDSTSETNELINSLDV